jgi:uncharacterized RDD family membrane protein YckC
MPQGSGWQTPAQRQDQHFPQAPQYPGAPQNAQWMYNVRATADGVPLASWGKRLLAWILDGIVITILGGLVTRVVAPGYFDAISNILDASSRGATPQEMNALASDLTTSALEAGIVVWLVSSAYCIAFWTTTAQTLGKMAVGISVRAADRPGPLTLGTAVLRRLVPLASQFVPLLSLLDGLWPLWTTSDRRCTTRSPTPRSWSASSPGSRAEPPEKWLRRCRWAEAE